MGLFDHLFKSKSPSSEEPSVETGGNPQEPVKRSDAADRTATPNRADPSVFLHPKSFVPRGATPLTPPGKSGAVSGVRKLGAAPAPPAADEIVLVLGDVLSRIPTPYLKIGPHDPKRELRFNINDLSSDIARGRAAVPLSRIAQLMPDIFVRAISPDEDTEVRLPLQKLVEQIGLLRSRPQGGSGERVARPVSAPPLVETIHPQPDPEIRLEPVATAAQTLAPAPEALDDLPALAEPVIELKPVAAAAAPIAVDPEPAPVDAPQAVAPAPVESSAPEIPTPDPVVATAPVAATPEETPVVPDPVLDTVKMEAALPAPEQAAASVPIVPSLPPEVPAAAPAPASEVTPPEQVSEPPAAITPESSQVAPTPVAELAPAPQASEPVALLPETPESTPVTTGEVAPQDPVSEPPVPAAPETIPTEPLVPVGESVTTTSAVEVAVPEVVESESGGERIQLSLAAILRECPPEIIVGDRPEIPDNVRITLPFAPIDRQLVMGYVSISAERFVAAVPASFQKHFKPEAGLRVSIPLEEVFQNLPDPVAALAASESPVQILAPAASASSSAPAEEKAPFGPEPEKNGSALEREAPEAADQPKETASLEPAQPEPPPIETATAAVPALDLPAFHLYVPPPPIILPEEVESPAVTSIAPEPPAEKTSPIGPTSPIAETEIPKNESLPTDQPMSESGGTASAPAVGDEPAVMQPPDPLVPDSSSPDSVRPGTEASSELPPSQTETEVGEGVAKDEPLSEPTFRGNSAAVFAEANQTIPAPQWARPFIVLPPPIFGFTPTPASEAPLEERSQTIGAEDVDSEFTEDDDFMEDLPPESEIAPMGPETAHEEGGVGSLQPENAPTEEAAPEKSLPGGPTIISIDFSEALVPPDESALTNAAPLLEITEVPPQKPVEPPPEAERKIDQPKPDEPESTVAETSAPESISIPAVDATPAAIPEEAPASDSGPVAAELPVEAPTNTIIFTVEGQFTERPFQSVPDWEPVVEQKSTPVQLPPLAAQLTPNEPKESDPAPLLTVPRFDPDSDVSEVLPPPALPLRRFDQDALQALFMTDEVLDLPRISRLAAQLPGVHACVIATRDQACTGGRLPEGFDLAALLGLAPRVGEAAGRMPIGALKHFTLYGDQYSVSFFERNGLSLCAVHRPRSFVPGVREKLVAIADELSK